MTGVQTCALPISLQPSLSLIWRSFQASLEYFQRPAAWDNGRPAPGLLFQPPACSLVSMTPGLQRVLSGRGRSPRGGKKTQVPGEPPHQPLPLPTFSRSALMGCPASLGLAAHRPGVCLAPVDGGRGGPRSRSRFPLASPLLPRACTSGSNKLKAAPDNGGRAGPMGWAAAMTSLGRSQQQDRKSVV